ncbi:MAG: 5'-methylthioadenosine phosphorylase, partial [uncultured Thermomicrobiales bacterium]
ARDNRRERHLRHARSGNRRRGLARNPVRATEWSDP